MERFLEKRFHFITKLNKKNARTDGCDVNMNEKTQLGPYSEPIAVPWGPSMSINGPSMGVDEVFLTMIPSMGIEPWLTIMANSWIFIHDHVFLITLHTYSWKNIDDS